MRKNLLFSSCVFLFIFFSNCQSPSSKDNSNSSNHISEQLDALVEKHFQEEKFNGSVLIADKGNVILNKEYGYSDLEKKNPLSSGSLFEIASISKQFTALLIMILKEENKLDYDDAIVKYFPNLPYKEITIRHLLTHTSGLSEKQFFGWAGKNMDPAKIYHNEIVLNS